MNYRYPVPERLLPQILAMEEFANGATQVSIKLNNGNIFSGVLISGATYIVAARGFTDLPFDVNDIDSVFQTADDKNPAVRGGWQYWDEWGS